MLEVEFLINHKYTSQDIKDFLKVHQANFIPDQLRNEDMIYKVDWVVIQYEIRRH